MDTDIISGVYVINKPSVSLPASSTVALLHIQWLLGPNTKKSLTTPPLQNFHLGVKNLDHHLQARKNVIGTTHTKHIHLPSSPAIDPYLLPKIADILFM